MMISSICSLLEIWLVSSLIWQHIWAEALKEASQSNYAGKVNPYNWRLGTRF
jgi:hypothetical protein